MKKIRTKMMLCICLIVVVSVLITGCVSGIMSYRSTVESLEQTLTETAEVAAGQVAAEISAYVNLVREFAYNSVLLEGESREERLHQLQSLKDNNGFAAVRMVDAYGIDLETGEDVSGQAYFQALKTTLEPQISEPLLTDHDEMLIYINVPMQQNGRFSGMVMGGLQATILSDIAASIQVGDGDCTILDSTGTVIGYKDFSQVSEGYNVGELSKSDPALRGLAALEAEMVQGKAGFGSYEYDGHREMMAYAPIPDSNGWSLSVAVLSSEFLGGTVRSLMITGLIMLATLVAAVGVSMALANSLSRPVVASAKRLAQLAQGDLDSPVPQFQTKDETGLLAHSLEVTVHDLRQIIQDITRQLGAMAQGDFTAHSDLAYKGGFLPIQQAINNISQSLNDTLQQIGIAADQVAAGADQVAAGAHALSSGTTQQAASVEELAATLNDISGQVVSTAELARQANQDVDTVGAQMSASDGKMSEMTQAMEGISQKATEIGKIIKTIEDIAFQTNILALNAAVEAARAGAAGKGFAVVADEVRSLANKSQVASKDTSLLIENSLSAVAQGAQLARETAQYLQASAQGSEAVVSSIARISAASAQQAGAISQVNQGVDQISAVVQNNSATAEESAAASQQLSSQAALLKELLSSFRLREVREPAANFRES